MKKIMTLLLCPAILLLTLLFFTSCGEGGSEGAYDGKTITLNVYNWGEYISDGFQGSMDTNAEFEKYYYEKFGVKVRVNYTTYATNEDMYSKLKSGAGTYDIVVPSDYMIQKMIEEDMLLAFNPAKNISNWANISDDFKGEKIYYDKESLYSVPYTYGMVGLIYNTALVDEEDYLKESWDLLWNPKYKGKILQFNNPRDAFATAMYLEGLDVNSTDKSVWEAALRKLSEQKPLVQGYVNDEIFNKMTTASAAIAPYYAGDYITMLDQNDDLAFYYPKEGTNYFIDAMCIPKNARHPEIAMEYINYMLSEEPAVANAIYVGYASPNTLVKNSAEYREEMGEEAISVLYGVSPDLINKDYNAKFGTACYKSFTPEIQAHVNTLWESLKTENSTELWVHITAGTIVGAVLTLAVYTTYVKKKRSRDYRMRDKAARLAKNTK
ncbi:MAG: spermidine/putrescine ABC transporter substrate-binding protein [Clostridia bacterium]|nr:spermidine/putrescine ABC transporter substrate-binding protein [Clostridia bacterium]